MIKKSKPSSNKILATPKPQDNIEPINNEFQTQNNFSEDFKDPSMKQNVSKFEYDLYHEEYDIAEKVIRVKRLNSNNRGERWKIFENDKVIFTLEGTSLSSKEKDFLRTIEGFNLLIKIFKQKDFSISFIKREIKKFIK